MRNTLLGRINNFAICW